MTHITPPAPGKKLGIQAAGANAGFTRAAYLPTNHGSRVFKFAASGAWRDTDGTLMVRIESDSQMFHDLPAEEFIRNKAQYQIRSIASEQYMDVIRQLSPEEREAFYPKRESPSPIEFGASTFGGTCSLQSVSIDVDSGDPVVVFTRGLGNTLYRDPQLTEPYRPDDMAELLNAREAGRVIVKITTTEGGAK